MVQKVCNFKIKLIEREIKETMNTGKVVQVLGPVVDVIFEDGELPEIFTALEINTESTGKLICEVQQHLGENTVRTVSMGATEGLSRGIDVKDLGSPITPLLEKHHLEGSLTSQEIR